METRPTASCSPLPGSRIIHMYCPPLKAAYFDEHHRLGISQLKLKTMSPVWIRLSHLCVGGPIGVAARFDGDGHTVLFGHSHEYQCG